jgi:hypothetical protein
MGWKPDAVRRRPPRPSGFDENMTGWKLNKWVYVPLLLPIRWDRNPVGLYGDNGLYLPVRQKPGGMEASNPQDGGPSWCASDENPVGWKREIRTPHRAVGSESDKNPAGWKERRGPRLEVVEDRPTRTMMGWKRIRYGAFPSRFGRVR